MVRSQKGNLFAYTQELYDQAQIFSSLGMFTLPSFERQPRKRSDIKVNPLVRNKRCFCMNSLVVCEHSSSGLQIETTSCDLRLRCVEMLLLLHKWVRGLILCPLCFF